MPRDLGDVLHYFIEQAEPEAPAPRTPSSRLGAATLPLVGVPIGERDVVRAAFIWNLGVEIARLGGRGVVLAPGDDEPSPLWPDAGPGPLGTEVVRSGARALGELYRDAQDLAVARAADASDGGLVLVRIPPRWLRDPSGGGGLLRWVLLFTASDRRDLLETYGLAKLLMRAQPRARIGVTVHGAQAREEAETAFLHLANVTARHLDSELTSYGLLVDDLDVYRAIVARRPIGLAHPQSPAAKALRDVAELLLEDARLAVVA